MTSPRAKHSKKPPNTRPAEKCYKIHYIPKKGMKKGSRRKCLGPFVYAAKKMVAGVRFELTTFGL